MLQVPWQNRVNHWRQNEADPLFCNKVGKPMVRNKVGLKLQEGLKELGIERPALHAFRHMAASELIENGVAPSSGSASDASQRFAYHFAEVCVRHW